MNGRKSREIRKAANSAAKQVGDQAAIGIIQALEYAHGLELRIKALEAIAEKLGHPVNV